MQLTDENKIKPLTLQYFPNRIVMDNIFEIYNYLFSFTNLINKFICNNKNKENLTHQLIIIPNKYHQFNKHQIKITHFNMINGVNASAKFIMPFDNKLIDKTIGSIKLTNNSTLILDRRDRHREILYVFDKYENDIPKDVIIFINKFDIKTNISRCYFGFDNTFFRFFPEQLINFISLNYFKKTLKFKEWIKKLYLHKYKHYFNIQSVENDKNFIKLYKEIFGQYFITNNYKRIKIKNNKNINKFNCKFYKELIYYIEQCDYTKYLINIFKKVNKEKDINTLMNAFNHLKSVHGLFNSERGNKKIVQYFNLKVNNKNELIETKDEENKENDEINEYNEAVKSIYLHLFHPMDFNLKKNITNKTEKKNEEEEEEEQLLFDHQIKNFNLGIHFNNWLKKGESAAYNNLKDEVTNALNKHKYPSISLKIYNKIANECQIIYDEQKENEFLYNLNELIALKLFINVTEYATAFSRVFHIGVDKEDERKYFINFAITLAEAFNYGGVPIDDEIYFGSPSILTSNNINNMILNAPIITSLNKNIAKKLSNENGIVWTIKQQTYKPLQFIFGININKINGISKYPKEEIVLFYNSSTPIIGTDVYKIKENAKYQLLYLFQWLYHLEHEIVNPPKFFKTIGVPFERLEKYHIKCVLFDMELKPTKIGF